MVVVAVKRSLRISTPESCQAAQGWVTQGSKRVPASDKFLAGSRQCATTATLRCDSDRSRAWSKERAAVATRLRG